MNAQQFIKEHGVEKAREVVEGATEWASHFDGYLYSEKQFHEQCFLLSSLKRLVESVDVVKQLDFWGRADVGIKKAKEVIKNNTLQASYYQPSSGCYYRYGRNSMYIVRDGKWKEIYGAINSNNLIHTDRLKQAIADYELLFCSGESK